MEEGNTKEVFFDKYCEHCKFYELESWEDPCDDCLAHGSNIDSHKPIHFTEED